MTAYSATFSNGATNRLKNSRRAYTHAWCWTGIDGDGVAKSGSGFSGSADLAAKAMASDYSWIVKKPAHGMGARIWREGWKPGKILFSEIVPVKIGGSS